MEQITKTEFELQKEKIAFFTKRKQAVFISPTDTIYGLTCNAEDDVSVKKVREIKERCTRPFSVIAPSKEWICNNCVVGEQEKKYLDKLPGPYTLILNLKNKNCISPLTNNGMDTIGVRMPDHWFTSFANLLGIPLITTSANKMGENFMTSIEDLDSRIKSKVDFIIYEGEKRGRPSKVFDLTKEEIEVIHR